MYFFFSFSFPLLLLYFTIFDIAVSPNARQHKRRKKGQKYDMESESATTNTDYWVTED